MADTDHQRPEGKLLGDAMKRDGRSARKIAEEIGLSDSRLRHIVNGYQPVGQGGRIGIKGPASTIARAAIVLGITPAELETADRDDAADELRNLLASSPDAPKAAEEPNVMEMLRQIQIQNQEILEENRAIRERLDELRTNPDGETG
jgi:transcriptional regulator with XRE-family HTH domain